jgi:GntR family transcriptional regulator of arabinose operon
MVCSGPNLHRITSVTVDETQIGHRAVEWLDRMRRRDLPLDDNETFVIPIGLSDGQTSGPAPAPRKTK